MFSETLIGSGPAANLVTLGSTQRRGTYEWQVNPPGAATCCLRQWTGGSGLCNSDGSSLPVHSWNPGGVRRAFPSQRQHLARRQPRIVHDVGFL